MNPTIFEAYNDLKKQLSEAGIPDSTFEAKQIIKHITGLSNSQILMKYNERLSDFQQNNLTVIIKQRLIRYPLQYILGKWDFYGRSFLVGVGVLIPRSDSECVVEKALKLIEKKQNPNVLDLCSGTGCLGITIAAERKDSSVTCLEKYDEALDYTINNITLNETFNVRPMKGDIFEGTESDKKYDLIISNPPYISPEEMKELAPELSFEPETALKASDGGLEFYKAIIKNYKDSLNEGGIMLFEIGYSQASAVSALLKDAGFSSIETLKDFSENDRVVFGTLI